MTDELFPDIDDTPVSMGEMVAELRRELAVRRSLYPGWVEDGRLSRRSAERRMKVLAAILKALEAENA
jgi:hypothetical protein